jgi:hypothetical protein
MRIAFGEITNANLENLSFCNYSNNITKALPTKWKLEHECRTHGAHKYDSGIGNYKARVERDIPLTNTDMINGMSGSSLYTRKGEFIGIGSTILKDKMPLNYDPQVHAVYIKTQHIAEILKAAKE